uniref:Uncharacterized protein n=1 Tax=Oryza rufipogon TaxID=4529 RepID=A0A1V1H022_ORYRU|nr:hypothetical protein [Oryza rufipogon]
MHSDLWTLGNGRRLALLSFLEAAADPSPSPSSRSPPRPALSFLEAVADLSPSPCPLFLGRTQLIRRRRLFVVSTSSAHLPERHAASTGWYWRSFSLLVQSNGRR